MVWDPDNESTLKPLTPEQRRELERTGVRERLEEHTFNDIGKRQQRPEIGRTTLVITPPKSEKRKPREDRHTLH